MEVAKRAMEANIWFADLVQRKGFGSLKHTAYYCKLFMTQETSI